MCNGTREYGKELDRYRVDEGKEEQEEQDKGKERQIEISTRERNKT